MLLQTSVVFHTLKDVKSFKIMYDFYIYYLIIDINNMRYEMSL